MNEDARHARRVRLIELLNELELYAADHLDERSRPELMLTRLKIIGLFESLEPKEKP